uniref:Uncharacterized protein n=1 Tax=viral metagenome TaxID=1070528 RepID=A0A6M3IR14_9ZZZZ
MKKYLWTVSLMLALALIFSVCDAKTLPHYLHGIKQISDFKDLSEAQRQIALITEEFRNLAYFKNQPASNIINDSIKREYVIYGKKVTIIYHNYVEGDKIRYYDKTGFIELTHEDFKAVEDDLNNCLRVAAEANAKLYKDFSQRIESKIASILDIQDVRDKADTIIPEYGIAYRDVFGFADIHEADFLPEKLYFTKIPEALGQCILNADIILYNPLGRVTDYIIGFPSTLAHEMVHNNPKLQSMPFAWNFDIELQTSYTQLAHNAYALISTLFHPYLDSVRFGEKVYFSFDNKAAIYRILRDMTSSTLRLDEEALEYEIENIINTKAELVKILPDFFAEFYANRLFWIAVDKKFRNNNTWFEALMASKYEPTILRNENDENTGAKEDLIFIKKLDDSGVIDDIRKEAWAALKEKKEDPDINSIMNEIKMFRMFYHVDSLSLSLFLKDINLKNPSFSDLQKIRGYINRFYEIERGIK